MVSTIKRPIRFAGLHTLTPISLELSAPPRLLTMASAFLTMIRMYPSPPTLQRSQCIADKTMLISMYGNAFGWPRQAWRVDPAPMANALVRPYDSQPPIFQRRDFIANDTSLEKDSDPAGVCHADLASLGNGKQDAYRDLDYDNLLFVDLDGNPVDGRTCNIIYEDDDPHSEVRIVLDENGKVVDMYMGDPDAGLWTREAVQTSNSVKVTVEPTTVTVTTGVPAGSESRPTFPASTTGSQTRSGSVVTPAPFAYRP